MSSPFLNPNTPLNDISLDDTPTMTTPLSQRHLLPWQHLSLPQQLLLPYAPLFLRSIILLSPLVKVIASFSFFFFFSICKRGLSSGGGMVF